MAETSALGAALAAGVASGIGVCKLTDIESSASDLFSPRITKQGTTAILLIKKTSLWLPYDIQ